MQVGDFMAYFPPAATGADSPANATLGVVLFICILSASTAIYLILELAQPFDGLMQLSNAGLRNPNPGINFLLIRLQYRMD